MASKTIEAKAEIVEIKRDGKYILVLEDITDERHAERIVSTLREWMNDTHNPVMVFYGQSVQLIDANEIKEIHANGKT